MHLKTPCCKCTATTTTTTTATKNVAHAVPHSHHGRMAPVFHRTFKTHICAADQQKPESFVAHGDIHADIHPNQRSGDRTAHEHRVFFL